MSLKKVVMHQEVTGACRYFLPTHGPGGSK